LQTSCSRRLESQVERTGAYGGVTSVYVRGGESNYNKVLLDGIPLNDRAAVSISTT
jgi:outer membrane cobalamin receptor